MTDSEIRLAPEGPQSLVLRADYDAYGHQVMKAHLDPAILAAWMGSPEMPLSVCEVDARAGGRYRMAWTRPDGSQSWMAGTILELAADRLVMTELHRPDWTHGELRVTLQVKDQDERAWLRRVVEFSSPAARGELAAAMSPGLKSCYGRLQAAMDAADEH
ncbi:MAG: SRPBCC domain-containing protein [Paracoccaceae bacterium]|nr:MAG: SRPBCC domain-containing protein [Paracoccaceae bacterium]